MFFVIGSQMGRAFASTVAIAALGAYTAVWIYAVGFYDPDKVDGLPVGYLVASALGLAVLIPGLSVHWLVLIKRQTRDLPVTSTQ